MMTMNQSSAFSDTLTNFNGFSSNQNNSFNQSSLSPDIDWSVFENADRYLLRDDSVWITRLSKDFWWNLERISEMTTVEVNLAQQMNNTNLIQNRPNSSTKNFRQQQSLPSPMQSNGIPPRKIVGQRSTIGRPNAANIPEKTNYVQNFSSISDQDIEYNPFQSKISFDNNIWTNYSQQAIPWQ